MKASNRLIVFLLGIFLLSAGQAQSLKELRNTFNNSPNDTVKLNTAKQLFAQYVYAKVDSAIYYAENVVNLGESLSMPQHVSNGIQYLGIAYSIKGDFQKAGEYMKQNLAYYEGLADSLNMAYTLNNIGVNYLYAEDWVTSSENFIRSARIKEAMIRNGNATAADVDLASTFMNVAITYDNQSDTLNAEAYFTRAIDEALSIGDTITAARAKNGLGNIRVTNKRFEEALLYYREIEAIFETENDLFALGKMYNNMALCYAELDNSSKVIEYADKAIATNQEIGNEQSEALALMYLGMGYQRAGRHKEAISISEKALEMGNKLETKAVLSGSYKNMYEAYSSIGDYKKAFENSVLYHNVDKELYSLERAEQIERLSAQYEADKRKIEIDQLNKDRELQSLLLSKANSERNLFLVLLISAVLFIALAFYFYRKIAQNRAELRVKNAELEGLNKTKDRFFAIISHDLRGHISSFQGTGRLLKHFMVRKDEAKLEAVTTEIDKNANNLSHLLDNLLQWSLDQLQGYQPKPEVIDVKTTVEELAATYEPLAKAKGLTISTSIQSEHMVMADKGSFYVTLRNLVANAIKFTEYGSISITSRREGKNLIILVQDTGIGIPSEMQQGLFEISEEKIRRGTQNEKGTGLGLNLAYEFTKMNGGKIELKSEEGVGTTFLVYLIHA